MKLINDLLLLSALLGAIFVPCSLIIYMYIKKQVDAKAFFYGILIYIAIRMIIYPLYYMLCNQLLANYQILIIKLLFDITFFAIIALFIKRIIYRYFDNSKYISMGLGEACFEIIFIFLPNLLNKNILNYYFNHGDAYQYFGATYSELQIAQFIETFNQTPTFYYLFLLLMIFGIILVNIYVSKNINHHCALIVLLFYYAIYILLSIFSYLWACIAIILLFIIAYKFLPSNINLNNKGEKHENISCSFNS